LHGCGSLAYIVIVILLYCQPALVAVLLKNWRKNTLFYHFCRKKPRLKSFLKLGVAAF